jgi:hypothetical protein
MIVLGRRLKQPAAGNVHLVQRLDGGKPRRAAFVGLSAALRGGIRLGHEDQRPFARRSR